MSDAEIQPYEIQVDDEVIDDLRRRLHATRWPEQMAGQSWVYGADVDDVRAICAYWADEYDWRAAEAELRRWPHRSTTIQGEHIHFLHVESERDDAVPLLLTHGWPGSIVEFLDLIEPLTAPDDPDTPAFHLVVPSLPGFGFSGPTVTTGVGPKRIASMWVELMARLGYDRYLAQGGDWGAVITGHVGALDPEHCAGIHLNMITVRPTPELMADNDDAENAAMAHLLHFRDHETGYQDIQGTKPQTLAFAMADSPAGLAAWILEKFRTWSDCDGDVFSVHDRDRFCTNLMLYWATNTAGSASRIYYEHRAEGRSIAQGVTVPMGGSAFPEEIYRSSRRWAEAVWNVVFWSEHDVGGHFAALEQPSLLLGDIRAFSQAVWK